MYRIVHANFAALFGLLICIIAALTGAWYALRPSERLLAVMRPLTLAAIFSALCSFALALVGGFNTVSNIPSLELNEIRRLAAGVTEGLAPVAASFASLTFAWGCVAIGMRRS